MAQPLRAIRERFFPEGEDPVKLAPESYKVIFENNKVRTLQARLLPKQKVGMHTHPDHLVYCLKECDVEFSFPDGKKK